jgi:hypothetical protein
MVQEMCSAINCVLKKKDMIELLTDGAPAGFTWLCHLDGSIQANLFTKLLDIFVNLFKPLIGDGSMLLIVDGHYSRTKNLGIGLVERTRENNVGIVNLISVLSLKCNLPLVS